MRTRLAVLVLAVLLAGLLGAAGTAFAVGPADGHLDNRTITVDGTGQVDLAPDAAEVRLSVTATASDAAAASQAVADDAAALRTALADFGIDDADVRSVGYDVHGDRGPRNGESAQYRARQTFVVTLSDVDRAGALIDAAVAGGADEVHGVSFTLSEDARADARDEALRAALENARSDADVLADAAALDVTGVRAMATTGTDVRPFHAEAAAVTADGANTDVDARDVTVSATVEVVFGADAA